MRVNLKIFAAFIIIISFFCLPIYYSFARKDLLEKLGCDNLINRSFVLVIIDVSDPYDAVDAERVVHEVQDLLSSLEDGSRFAIICPNQYSPYSPIESIGGCITPILPTSANFLMSEEEHKKFVTKRASTINTVYYEVDRILRKGPQRYSPLMETLIALSKRYDFRNAESVKIVIYSDMEQNSNSISVYGKSKQQIKSIDVSLEQISLNNAQIEVRRIVRRTKLGLIEFEYVKRMWEDWFFKSQAEVVWIK